MVNLKFIAIGFFVVLLIGGLIYAYSWYKKSDFYDVGFWTRRNVPGGIPDKEKALEKVLEHTYMENLGFQDIPTTKKLLTMKEAYDMAKKQVNYHDIMLSKVSSTSSDYIDINWDCEESNEYYKKFNELTEKYGFIEPEEGTEEYKNYKKDKEELERLGEIKKSSCERTYEVDITSDGKSNYWEFNLISLTLKKRSVIKILNGVVLEDKILSLRDIDYEPDRFEFGINEVVDSPEVFSKAKEHLEEYWGSHPDARENMNFDLRYHWYIDDPEDRDPYPIWEIRSFGKDWEMIELSFSGQGKFLDKYIS